MRLPRPLPPHERPPLFNRSLMGVTFRWPRWWEWVAMTLVSVGLLSLGSSWHWTFGIWWAFWAFRLGPLLNFMRPLPSVAVAVLVLLAVNAGVVVLLLAGLALYQWAT